MSTAIFVDDSRVTQSTATAATTTRLVGVDLARYLSAIAVAWIHIAHIESNQPSVLLARFAVPFFCALSGFLGISSLLRKPNQSWLTFVRTRFLRLYMPFLVWSFAYLLFKLAKQRLLPNQPSELPGLEFLVFGGAYHLWFFPYIAAGSLLTFAISKAIRWEKVIGDFSFILFGSGAVMALSSNPFHPNLAWSYMWDATPGLLWGIGLGYWVCNPAHRELRHAVSSLRPFAFGLAGFCFVFSAWSVFCVGRSTMLESISGVSLLAACLLSQGLFVGRERAKENPGTETICQLGGLSMGVYCVHLLVIKIAEVILSKLGLSGSTISELLLLAGTIGVSTSIAWVLSRNKATRWLVT